MAIVTYEIKMVSKKPRQYRGMALYCDRYCNVITKLPVVVTGRTQNEVLKKLKELYGNLTTQHTYTGKTQADAQKWAKKYIR
jgi:S-adenosylmethionine hydrolase